MNIDTLQPGRELDAMVAEKVFGKSVHVVVEKGSCFTIEHEYLERGDYFTYVEQTLLPEQVSHYSTDISAAWLVVEKFKQENKLMCVMTNQSTFTNGWICEYLIGDNELDFIEADTAPLAICRAALKATMQ